MSTMTAISIPIAIPLYPSQGSSGRKVLEEDHYPIFTGKESEIQGVCYLAVVTLLVRCTTA